MPRPDELQALANLHAQRAPMGPPMSARPPTEMELVQRQAVEDFQRENSKHATLKELSSRESQITAQIAELQTALRSISAHRAALEKELNMHQKVIDPTAKKK